MTDPVSSSLLRQEGPQQDLTPKPTQRRDLHQEDSRWEPDHKRCVLRGECDSLLFVTIDGIEWCAKCGANAINGRKGAVIVPELLAEIKRKQARIEVLEGSIDDLRNVIDHPVTQDQERWALILPEGVSALEAKSLTTGRLLSDADCFQWVKAVDVADYHVPPAEGEK